MQKNFWQQLKKPIIGLAPMDGVTDEPMRQIQCLIAKPDVVYTEFISVEGFVRKPEVFLKKLTFKENERPVVAQVFGETPDDFYSVLKQLCQMGFDGIDINMGCPAKSVLQRGGGAALVGDYQPAEKIIKKSLEAIEDSGEKVPLSVKTRISENPLKTKKWFSFLSKFTLAEVTVHGRRLKQGNAGPVNWEEIILASEILKTKRILCLGNGGIKSIAEAREKCKKYNLDGILIGQAALGNPWIFRQDFQPTKKEILAIILKHAELVWNFYGEKGFVTVLKHFGWYPKGFKGAKNLKRELLKTKNLKEAKRVIVKFSD